MTAPASATPPSRATSWTTGARIALGVAIAVLALMVVGVVAGSPDAERDLVDANHLGPRLVLLTIILTAIGGLVIFALSARNPVVRALGLIAALVLSGAIVAILEMPGPPGEGPAPSADVILRVAQPDEVTPPPSPAVLLVDPDRVTVADPGRLTNAEIEILTGAAEHLQGREGLSPATANGPVETASRNRLAFQLAAEDPSLAGVLDPPDVTPILVGARAPTNRDRMLDVDLVTTDRPDELSASAEKAIDDVVGDLEGAGYDVWRIDVNPDEPAPRSGQPGPTAPMWNDALLSLGLFLLAVTTALAIAGGVAFCVWWVLTRRFGWARDTTELLPLADPTAAVSPDAIRRELAGELDRAIDELPLEGDPRHVVLAAYVRMTAVLADRGIPRRPSDTPLEYLARALGELDAGTEPIQRLTRLMEVAMFSTHTVDADMASEAVAAFRAVRDSLHVVEPV